jgi:hypothetical protein
MGEKFFPTGYPNIAYWDRLLGIGNPTPPYMAANNLPKGKKRLDRAWAEGVRSGVPTSPVTSPGEQITVMVGPHGETT